MSGKTKILGLVLSTAMVLGLPMIVWADGSGDKDSWGKGGDWHHEQEEQIRIKVLNLSDDQEKQLNENHQKQKDVMKNVFEQMKANREAFDAEIVKVTPDMNKINDLQNQLKTIQAGMADNRLSAILATKKIMSPEQFAGYMALEREEHLMKHHEEPKHWERKQGANHDPDFQE